MKKIIGSIIVATLALSTISFANEKKDIDYTAPYKALVKEVRATIPNANLTKEEYQKNINKYTLVDIRDAAEFATGYIDGAINVSRGKCEKTLPKNLKLSPENKKIILFYCNSDKRSVMTTRNFIKMGFNVKYLLGGLKGWIKNGGKIVTQTSK